MSPLSRHYKDTIIFFIFALAGTILPVIIAKVFSRCLYSKIWKILRRATKEALRSALYRVWPALTACIISSSVEYRSYPCLEGPSRAQNMWTRNGSTLLFRIHSFLGVRMLFVVMAKGLFAFVDNNESDGWELIDKPPFIDPSLDDSLDSEAPPYQSGDLHHLIHTKEGAGYSFDGVRNMMPVGYVTREERGAGVVLFLYADAFAGCLEPNNEPSKMIHYDHILCFVSFPVRFPET